MRTFRKCAPVALFLLITQMTSPLLIASANADDAADAAATMATLNKTRDDYTAQLKALQAIPVALQTPTQKEQIVNYQTLIGTLNESIAAATSTDNALSGMDCNNTCDAQSGRLDAMLNDKSCMNVPACAQCTAAFLDTSIGTGQTGLGDMCTAMSTAKSSKGQGKLMAYAYSADAAICITACVATVATGWLAPGSSIAWNKACQIAGYATIGIELFDALVLRKDVSGGMEKAQTALMGKLGASTGVSSAVNSVLDGNNFVGKGVARGIDKAANADLIARDLRADKIGVAKISGTPDGEQFIKDVSKNNSAKLSASITACIGAAITAKMAVDRWKTVDTAHHTETGTCNQIVDYTRGQAKSVNMTASCKVQVAVQRLGSTYRSKTDPTGKTNTQSDPVFSNFTNSTGTGLGDDLKPFRLNANDPKISAFSGVLGSVAGDKKLLAQMNSIYPGIKNAIQSGTTSLGDLAKIANPNLPASAVTAMNDLGTTAGTAYASLDPNKTANDATLAALAAAAEAEKAGGGAHRAGANAGGEGSGTSISLADPSAEGAAAPTEGAAFGEGREPASAGESEINMDASKNLFQLVSGRLLKKKQDASVTELSPVLKTNQ